MKRLESRKVHLWCLKKELKMATTIRFMSDSQINLTEMNERNEDMH